MILAVSLSRSPIVALFLVASMALLIAIGFWGYSYDDAFITYRYAQNWVERGKLVYNLDRTVFGTTAPGYALLLGGLTVYTGSLGIGIPQWGTILSVLSIFTLIMVIAEYTQKSSPWYRTGLPLLFAICTLSLQWNIELLGTETFPVLALLTVAAFLIFEKKQQITPGLLVAFAIILRQDAGLGALIVGVILWREQKRFPWRFILAILIPVSLWFLFLIAHFGQVLPQTLYTKRFELDFSQQDILYTFEEWRWFRRTLPSVSCIALFTLSTLGIVILFRNGFWRRPLFLSLGLWVLGLEVSYRLLNVHFAPWYHISTVNALVALTCLCAIHCGKRLLEKGRQNNMPKLGLLSAIFLVCLLLSPILVPSLQYVITHWCQPPDPRFQIYRQIGEFIHARSDLDDMIATVEIGIIGYTSRRPILDLMGLVNPEVIEAKAKHRLPQLVARNAPKYIVDNPIFRRHLLQPILNYPDIRGHYRVVKTFRTADYQAATVRLLERIER